MNMAGVLGGMGPGAGLPSAPGGPGIFLPGDPKKKGKGAKLGGSPADPTSEAGLIPPGFPKNFQV